MDERHGLTQGRLVVVTGLVGLMLMATACSSDIGGARTTVLGASSTTIAAASTTTSIPRTTTTETATTLAPIDAVGIAMDAIGAWNSGDFDGWLAFWVVDQDEDDHLFSRSVMNSNEQIAVTPPCEVTAPDAGMVRVVCPALWEDDFHGPGGVTGDGTLTFLLDGNGLIVEDENTGYRGPNGECCPIWQEYNRAFHVWLAEAHPDVYEVIGPHGGSPLWYLPGYANGDAEHMKIALEYVDEFIAQSDVYPLEDGAV